MCHSAQKEVREIVINELIVLSMNNTVQDKILSTVEVAVNGRCNEVELIVDTGSVVSIISKNTCHRLQITTVTPTSATVQCAPIV